MEVVCPKCHFVQPKDQYCARCGVDMQKYKPQSISVFKKLNLRTSLLFLIAMAVLGLTIFIFTKSDKPLTDTFNQNSSVKSFRNTEKMAPAGAAAVEATPSEENNSPDPESRTETVDLKVADEGLLNQFSGSNRTRPANNSGEFANPRIKISFVEINHDQLNNLLEESQNQRLLQRDGDQFKGIISNISHLGQIRYKTLKQEVKEMRPNQIEAFFFGRSRTESSQFVGLQLNLEKKSTDGSDEKWVLTANISKSTTKETETYDLTMSRNSAFFMNVKNWIASFENERALIDTPPFSVLTSSDFLNQRTEIIILLEIY